MTDYLPLLSRAVASLDKNVEARRAVYDRARSALLNQLRTMNPPLAESEITRERLALEEAIRRIEGQAPKADPGAVAPSGSPVPKAASAPRPAASPAGPPAAGPVSPPRPPAPSRERLAETPTGSRVMREAVTGAQQLGTATAEASRSARDTFESYDLEAGESAEPRARAGRVSTEDALAEPLQPRGPRGRTSIDFAKADARRAMKAKLIVGGIVGALLGVAILIGIVHRDRILASLGLGSAPTRTAVEASRTPDRIAPAPKAEQRAPGTNVPAAAVAQRAVLYEENPSGAPEQLQTFVGTAVWRTETFNPGPGRPPELGLRVDVEIPDRKMTIAMTVRRNPDQTLPASHTIEVQFSTPGDPFGGVANLPGIRAKTTETAQGAPLVGLVVRVMPGFFLVGLSAIDADREQNLSLLRERGWLDVPFVYNNGRRAVLVIEKGTPGERAVNEAIAAWGG